MKTVILAGGYGTRISEESHLKPKPMIEIGDMPILWHIMKIYSHFGFNEFIVCLGYKGNVIKEFFANYFLYESDVTFSFGSGIRRETYHGNTAEDWTVTLVNTGMDAMTGARIKKIQRYIGNETFMLTYGDGVSNVDINKLLQAHAENKKYITVTAVQPRGRFGSLDLETDNTVKGFLEKPKGDGGWISAGLFVCEPQIFDYIGNDESVVFEREPLEVMAKDGQFAAFRHDGFWQPMDTMRDKDYLEGLWNNGNAPWKLW